MRLNIKAFTITAAILWALAVFIVGIANLIWTGYGLAFLEIVAAIYPGYDATPSFGEVISGTLYAVVDGAVCGLLFSWVYNLFVVKFTKA